MDLYDGIPVADLPIEAVDWEHRAEYIQTRSRRRPGDFDVDPAWATEAALDPHRLVAKDRASKSGEGVRIVGYSSAVGRVLTVLLIPKEHPPERDWWGVNAWLSNERDRRSYEEEV